MEGLRLLLKSNSYDLGWRELVQKR